MSTHNIHLKYRTPKRYPTIISIVPPGVALIVTFRGSNYRCLEQIFMVPKGFEPSKFDWYCDDIGVVVVVIVVVVVVVVNDKNVLSCHSKPKLYQKTSFIYFIHLSHIGKKSNTI